MKKTFLFLITLLSFFQTFASHIAGGELFYEYLGRGSSSSGRYKITMRVFRDCISSGQSLQTERVIIGIYGSKNYSLHSQVTLVLQNPVDIINLNTNAIPCLINAPEVCYQVGIFTGTVDLPIDEDGFILSWIRCCRIDNIGNLSRGQGVGGTFVTRIPGTKLLASGNNSSPKFAVKDTALVCQNKNFLLDFGATDPDGDKLTFSFCNAYAGGTPNNPNPGSSPSGLPEILSLTALPYQAPYEGESPLGPSVSINPDNGKITGIAPSAGRYVINVCVTEWRNGVAINQHRKDFILQVGDCDYAAAEPVPVSGAYCKDFKVNFSNNGASSTIQSYEWDFGVESVNSDVSTAPEPIFTYPDTGMYKVRLIVKGRAGCVDTGFTTLGVYPGFTPDFEFTGSCFEAPFHFTDKSSTAYGTISKWSWNFGDLSTAADTSTLQNPAYQYADTGTRNVTLTVQNSKGCKETVVKTVKVNDKPYLFLPFSDTLICSIDTLAVKAQGTGSFTWKPEYNIINSGSASPLVFPKNTTTYTVTLQDKGCVASASVKINVLDSITVYAGRDTSICATDAVMLKPVSQGLQYRWTPASAISGSADVKNAIAKPDATTTYTVTATLGKCQATDTIDMKVVPYPVAKAGTDATICFGKQTQLSGSVIGAFFNWSPTESLLNANTLHPVAKPLLTTLYVLAVYDTLGCPKPATDTVAITVAPRINAFAGNDTTIVANQPLQLNASGGTIYQWTPTTGMNNAYIANPLVVLPPSYDSITYRVKVSVAGGCSEEDDIKVKLFKTGPDIFVPTAFTPNADGKNDFLKPIPVGIRSVYHFNIYNRWGQLLYSSGAAGRGWDGTFAGKDQPAGTYVFTAEGVDYLGKMVFKKGAVLLVR